MTLENNTVSSANPSNHRLFQICLSQLYAGHLVVCSSVFLPAASFFYEAAERVWRRLLQRNLKLSSYCIILICMYLSLRYFRSKLVIGHV